jgi:hypothetical protein
MALEVPVMTTDPLASGAVPVPDPWRTAGPASRSPLLLAGGADEAFREGLRRATIAVEALVLPLDDERP